MLASARDMHSSRLSGPDTLAAIGVWHTVALAGRAYGSAGYVARLEVAGCAELLILTVRGMSSGVAKLFVGERKVDGVGVVRVSS